MGSEDRYGKVPLISKIAYGFGDVGCNFSWMFVSNFLMIFYTDVFGISMTAVSALMLFSRFWDAINDPMSEDLRIRRRQMGTVPSVAAHCGACYSDPSDDDVLGTSGLVGYIQDHLYGDHILPAGVGIYLCKHSIRNALRRNDTGH